MRSGWILALFVLVVIGALNWGLVGFFNWNFVDAIFGADPIAETNTAARVVYAIVGIAGLILLFALPARTPPTRV